MSKKKSLRVEIESELHEKLRRVTMLKNTTAADLIREAIASLPEPQSYLELDFFVQNYSRYWDKLKFWTRQRMFRDYSSSDTRIEVAVEQEVQRYLGAFFGVTSTSDLMKAFSYWDKILTYQEKAVVGEFFPFNMNLVGSKEKFKFFTNSSFYNLKDGEYIVLAEPEVDGFTVGGRTVGIITRNAYSAHILNAPDMMIVDVDTDWSDDGNLDCVVAHEEQVALLALRLYQAKTPGSSFRVYRTAKGLRYIRTDEKISPKYSYWAMRQLMADPKYRALCLFQETYRARLTPKPWRTDYSCYWEPTQQIESDSEYRVCRFIETIGDPEKVLDEFKPMIEYHDTWTKALDKDEDLSFA